MPFYIDWLIPHRAINVLATGSIRSEDFDIYSDTLVRLLTEAQTHAPNLKVYNLFDSTTVKTYPPMYLMFKRALPVLRFQNRGPMYLITPNRATRSFFELTAHISSFSLQAFDNRQEALAALENALIREEA